jgi:hypothetical protein
VKVRIEEWVLAADLCKSRLFRPVTKGGKLAGEALSDENAIWYIVLKYAKATSLGKLSPHDMRRTCAKLCRKAGGDLEQIQMLLVHPDHRALLGYRAEPDHRSERRSRAQVVEKCLAPNTRYRPGYKAKRVATQEDAIAMSFQKVPLAASALDSRLAAGAELTNDTVQSVRR